MSTARSIVLVHGACHGAWCWDAVVPLLAAHGFAVRAVDLPGRGDGRRPGWRFSLADYAGAVVAAIEAMEGPVIGVAHSMGGQILSAAAERVPERLARLVYVSAFLPMDGDSIVAMSKHNAGSDIASATHVSLLRGQLTILKDRAGAVFYGDCPPAAVAAASARLVPESLRPSFQAVRLSEGRYGSVPRSYIRCGQDRALSPAFQDWMLARRPCERVLSLDASHAPFLSMPGRLAAAIGEAIN
jgi:pimeloyl-ACP methyl ester carboxylesterase